MKEANKYDTFSCYNGEYQVGNMYIHALLII